MNGYAFTFEGHGSFTPDGRLPADVDAAEHNRQTEARELEYIRSAPERLFLYVKSADSVSTIKLTTWLGTVVCEFAWIGRTREFPCFGPFPSRRAPVTARIFGTLYHGWYYVSSGDYCRLKKAKRQGK